MSNPIDTFILEAQEHLINLEEALLHLETDPHNIEHIDTAFRAIHTIKGSGGMFGYNDLTQFTHHIETILDQIRNKTLDISPEIIGIFLETGDLISTCLDNTQFTDMQKTISENILHRLATLTPTISKETIAVTNQPEPPQTKSNELLFYRIRFTPHETTFKDGFDVQPIIRELHSFGDCLITTHINKLPEIQDFDPELCYLRWDITLTSSESLATIEDVFIFVSDDWDISIDQIHYEDSDEHPDRLGDLLVSRGVISADQLEDALEAKPKIGQLLSEKGLVDETEIEAALNEQKIMRQLKEKKMAEQTDSTVKVPASRLDQLMNLVGELVIVQARLNQVAHHVELEDVQAIAEELDHLTTQMRDQTFSIRMLPIGTTFGRFRRLVRDLSKELNKKIELQTYGAETELDKMVIDKLADPLVHLIRNSIDHGIETSEVRKEKNKSSVGHITLSAEHSNSHVIIKIKDDGKGLDVQSIKAKAIEKALISEEESLTDEQIHMLIFEPGFSTAEKVSDISGRGVGMDVVKRSIAELGGNISISSIPHQGTEFTVRLPMTLAIIEGLMVMVGQEHYVLPLNSVEECIEMQSTKLKHNTTKRLVDLRGEQIPFLHLREWFQVSGDRPSIEQVVITHLGEERFGFCVDEVIGQYQTVIKRLGKLYEGTVGFSGATILGDGSVAMILDPQALMETVKG